jgi:hypothetical protein
MLILSGHRLIMIMLIATLAISLVGCEGDTDQSRILKLVAGIAKAAEKKDVDGFLSALAGDYRDFENRDKRATREFLSGYLGSRVGIVVHILHIRTGVILPEGTASLEADVVVSAGAAEVLRKLTRFIGEVLRFKVELRRTGGEWFVSAARWQVVERPDLFPESLSVLKKLYPYL